MPEAAFLFPGQGSQFVGMVEGFKDYSEAMEIFERAAPKLEFDLFDLCLNGPEEKLSRDFYAQVAVHVTNCAYAAVLKRKGFHPRVASGFSLGIFSALAAAGSLSFEQALDGVRVAADKMSEEGLKTGGAMAAVIGLSEGDVREVCGQVANVYLASVNTAQQMVISGREEAVEKAIQMCHERGALLIKRLPIGWAIHTPLMETASLAFAEYIREWEVRPPAFPVLGYLEAMDLKTGEDIKKELSSQFSRPNWWHQVLLRMQERGVESYIEVGPGNVLTQMVRWVDRSARVFTAREILEKSKV